jgi:multimeric flavodoxin WrbA
VKHLLVVFHSRSGGAAAMAAAVESGARSPEITGVTVRVLTAPEAGVDEVVWADAVVIGTPENFGSVAGLVKDFLERIYHPCLDRTAGMPYALFVRAGNDGNGAVSAVDRILTGLRWRVVRPPVIAVGDVLSSEDLERCRELGQELAGSLELGLF